MKITRKKVIFLVILGSAILMLSPGYQGVVENITVPFHIEVLKRPEATSNGTFTNESILNITGDPSIAYTEAPDPAAPAISPISTKVPDKNIEIPDTISIPDAAQNTERTSKPNRAENYEENETKSVSISNNTKPVIEEMPILNRTEISDENETKSVSTSNNTKHVMAGTSIQNGAENYEENETKSASTSNNTKPVMAGTSIQNAAMGSDDDAITSNALTGSNNTSAKETDNKAPTPELNFALVSDTHISDRAQNTRLINTIIEINKIHIDALVITGDVVMEPTDNNYESANVILEKLNVLHLLVMGNHDGSESSFKENFGQEPERIDIIKGYQIISIGMENGQWSFDFSRVNKDLPTIIFVHGPAWGLNGKTCEQTWKELGYACSMNDKLNEFSNLLAVVAGHVHMYSEQETNGVLYLTLNNLEGFSPSDNFVILTINNRKVSLRQIAI